MIAIINELNAIQELYNVVCAKTKYKKWDSIERDIYKNILWNSYYANVLRREMK